MKDKQEIERRIRELLTVEMDANTFFDIVLRKPDGLFRQLADSREEMVALGKGELWQLVFARQIELSKREMAGVPQMMKELAQAAEPLFQQLGLEMPRIPELPPHD